MNSFNPFTPGGPTSVDLSEASRRQAYAAGWGEFYDQLMQAEDEKDQRMRAARETEMAEQRKQPGWDAFEQQLLQQMADAQFEAAFQKAMRKPKGRL